MLSFALLLPMGDRGALSQAVSAKKRGTEQLEALHRILGAFGQSSHGRCGHGGSISELAGHVALFRR